MWRPSLSPFFAWAEPLRWVTQTGGGRSALLAATAEGGRGGMAAGHLQQFWGTAGLSLSRGVLMSRFAALRPLGLLVPPRPRPLVMGIRGLAEETGLGENPFFEKYQMKIQELRKYKAAGRPSRVLKSPFFLGGGKKWGI